jgi:hypothetical protein
MIIFAKDKLSDIGQRVLKHKEQSQNLRNYGYSFHGISMAVRLFGVTVMM